MSDDSPRTFIEKLERRWAKDLFVCVGLDPRIERIPQSIKEEARASFEEDASFADVDERVMKLMVAAHAIKLFNMEIIDETHKAALAYKPNIAFYERWGSFGITALKMTIDFIRETAPEVPIILDAKRADIGSTNDAYVDALLMEFGMEADAVT